MKNFSQLAEILADLQAKHGIDPEMTDDDYMQEKVRRYNETEGKLHEIDGYNCKVCKNKGFIARVAANGYEEATECRCKPIRATLNRAKRSGLGDILKENTFDKYLIKDEWQRIIKEKAQAFCNDDAAKWFFIGGQSGAGKTHLCTAIAAHYIKAGQEVKYMVWCEESKTLKALANDFTYRDEIEIYKNVDVLYIDDFLKTENDGKPSGADLRLAFEIINRRILDKNKVTIISSEYTLGEVIDFDEATMGRVAEKTGEYKINIAKDRKKNYRLKDVTL